MEVYGASAPMEGMPIDDVDDGYDAVGVYGGGTFRNLVRWYRPYLRGTHRLITITVVATVMVLVAQAFIPLIVDRLLRDEKTAVSEVVLLLGLIALQVIGTRFAHDGGARIDNQSSLALQEHIFDRTLRSEVVRQRGMVRSSVVLRHSSDVERVGEALVATVAGIPGLIRVAQSLVLLLFIYPSAGVAAAVGTLFFLVLAWRLGRTQLANDHEKLSASSRLGALVDESISTSRVLDGIHLDDWQRSRFAVRAQRLFRAKRHQAHGVTRLETATVAAGLIGTLAVVLFASAFGKQTVGVVAASLLYIEGIVAGLDTLPPWIRAVQLAAVSQHRIDEILTRPDRVTAPSSDGARSEHNGDSASEGTGSSGLALDGVSFHLSPRLALHNTSVAIPTGGVVGVVAPMGTEPDALLALLAGDEDPESGRITLDGFDVRLPGVLRDVYYVPDEAAAFDASVIDQIRAADPGLDRSAVELLLDQVQLGHLAELPAGLDRPLGPSGGYLTVNERQRLFLAGALAAHPRVLLVGSLQALADVDTARPFLELLRRQGAETTLVSVRNPDIADQIDLILFPSDGTIHLGTHQELLVELPEYSHLWNQRLGSKEVDLSVLGLSTDDEASLYVHLVTERYSPGDVIYRQGSPADRIVFVVSGMVDIYVADSDGQGTVAGSQQRRVASISAGNHCGDLELSAGQLRAETAVAGKDCVIRSLSREVVAAGLSGLLDRPPMERHIITSILRDGPGSSSEIHQRLLGSSPTVFDSALASLVRDGAVRDDDGRFSVVQKRQVKLGVGSILDRLGGL